MVSENGMGMPAIVGDATGGKVRRRWRVPIRIDSDLLLLRRGRCDKTDCAKQTEGPRVTTVVHGCLSYSVIRIIVCRQHTVVCRRQMCL